MAVKHVTVYECDVCKAHVDDKGLTAVKVGTIATEVCKKCLLTVEIGFKATDVCKKFLRTVEIALGLDYPEAAEPIEHPHHTR